MAVDSSAYAPQDGVLVGGPVWVSGRVDGGLSFDGVDDRVDLPAAVVDGLGDVTSMLWIKTSKTGAQGLLSGANAANNNELLIFLASDTVVRFYTGQSDSSHVKWSIPSIADGVWHHLAVTRNTATGQVILFLDGISRGTRTTILNPLSVAPGGFLIGQEQDSVGGGFDVTQALAGSVDDIRIYDTILTATEIATIANP